MAECSAYCVNRSRVCQRDKIIYGGIGSQQDPSAILPVSWATDTILVQSIYPRGGFFCPCWQPVPAASRAEPGIVIHHSHAQSVVGAKLLSVLLAGPLLKTESESLLQIPTPQRLPTVLTLRQTCIWPTYQIVTFPQLSLKNLLHRFRSRPIEDRSGMPEAGNKSSSSSPPYARGFRTGRLECLT